MMGAGAAGAFALSPMQAFLARKAMGQNPVVEGFGSLSPKAPSVVDTRSTPVFDIKGVPLLEIPAGFAYAAFHVTGMNMSDRNLCPSNHDGMAWFAGPRGSHILVQNHEVGPGATYNTGLQKAYDRFDGDGGAGAGAGGTTNIIVDANGRVLRDYVSLSGTIRNCAGGPTPWGSWITCEENTTVPADNPAVTKKHGFNFEVPARGGQRPAVPLEAMGRFNHEAVAVDPATGYVYETEDRGDSCLYRYIPNKPGNLDHGGELQVLKLVNGPQDTRTGVLSLLNQPLSVEWVSLTDNGVNINPDEDILRFDAQALGGAIFARGEGAWAGNGKIYWVCTSGGDQGNGQVWCYDDQTETVTLFVESTDQTALDNPDNITVNPADGSLYLMEDGGGEQFVVGVTPSGGLFKLCRNNINTSEFAGGCFSADGKKFFVNIQSPGITIMLYRTNGQPIIAA
ncbi:phosphatase [filamentous cyanobacterium CCP5]|nr:phosphatase [filamentous cyanobacterium CCP5]